MSMSRGFSLMELMAVLALLGVVAMTILPRVAGDNAACEAAACHAHQGDIEIQSELWLHNTGSWPAANLADIEANTAYFPEGLPTCPVDGTAYTIDSAGRVVGHDH